MRVRAALAGVGLALALAAAPAYATTITWTAFGTQGHNGWYVSDVYINWTVTEYTPPITDDQCPRSVHLTADTRDVGVSCSITTLADGVVSASTAPIKIDRTPPTALAAVPDRPPDVGPWYDHPLAIAWSGTDAMSGIASCTTLTYSGPDSGSAQAAGGCQDEAGNSAVLPFSLLYDATPPALLGLKVVPSDHRVRLSWAASPDTVLVQVVRSPGRGGLRSSVVFSGRAAAFLDRAVRNGAKYHYSISARDAAGNAVARAVSATPSRLQPAFGARLRRPPLLRWPAVKRASYYNMQLLRGDQKILTAWPAKPHVQLRRVWSYRGHRHRLVHGRYRWYVWPGFGRRSTHRYGRRIGGSRFSIIR